MSASTPYLYRLLRHVILPVLFIFPFTAGFAQQQFTISGYVRDSTNGESLTGATVRVKGSPEGIQANTYGYYAISLPPGQYTLECTFIGYGEKEQVVQLDDNMQLNFSIVPRVYQAKEVVVTGERGNQQVTSTEMGRVEMATSDAKKLPSFLGEVDVLKSMQLVPGVQAAGEGNAGLYVRGGGPDQNLILLDEAPVYNTGHLFGFFSIFNADAIRSTTLIKGGMPASYGGRLSAVVDVNMKDGNNQRLQGEGGIGLIASRLSLQGPLKKGKSSFIISGRRTYIDWITKPFVKKDSDFSGSGYYFYDLNMKANYIFSDKDRVYLSGYFGRDVFTFRSGTRTFDASIPWGNTTATLRWNHVFSSKLFSNTSLIYNDYKFSFTGVQNNFDIHLSSGISDANGKLDFDYFASQRHHIKFGGNYIYHRFTPYSVSGRQDSTAFNPDNAFRKYAHEAALYIQDEWEISHRLKLNAGLRYSGFMQVGPYTRYVTGNNGVKLDSTVYQSLQQVRAYGGLEPRVIVRYAWNDRNSVKASATRNYQFIHLVTNAGTTLPTDLWVPSTYKVRPQISWQYTMGYYRNFNNNSWETSVEVYYKDMQHQIEYRQGYTPSLTDPENDFVFGKGWAYGAEFFINKTKGRFTGWIGYTLAWTWRQFPDLNQGKKFPAKYDRRHDLVLVGNYQLTPKWNLSTVFIYGSGNTTTLPSQFYMIEGSLVQEYGNINGYRMAPYHRLDLSAVYTPNPKGNRRFRSSWAFSIYNVYSRQNPYFLYFDQTGAVLGNSLTLRARQVSLFPILPSVTWNFKF
ncbi:MAG TPA: TonB-dependent receptor [Chitinophaga sp.]|uniref:TonB-dependent receptor n=1 Tax=Chitinophaga sp. TaxID=1869181 RepID=UPI002DB79681|nr:TonB-dependent receptor [Chitinophaga sp.]HEU4554820.1 TonB-dependent receptor [Chitinophaga sp.]